jgi:hypothetical protein
VTLVTQEGEAEEPRLQALLKALGLDGNAL